MSESTPYARRSHADWFDEHLTKSPVQSGSEAPSRVLVPLIEDGWWQIAGNPDLGN